MVLIMVEGPTWEVVTGKGLAILMLSAMLGVLWAYHLRYKHLAEEEVGWYEEYELFIKQFVPDATIAECVKRALSTYATAEDQAIREKMVLEVEGLRGLHRLDESYESVDGDIYDRRRYNRDGFNRLYSMAEKQNGVHELHLRPRDPMCYLPPKSENLEEEVGTTSID
jgi:hypothetical protein